MKTAMTTRNGQALTLECSTLEIRDSKGVILPMKKWIESKYSAYADLPAETQKEIKSQYNLAKATALRENKAMAAAMVSHDGMAVKRIAVRTVKDGSITFSISGGEKPKEKPAKAGSKTALLQVQNEKLLAEIAALKAAMRGQSIPQGELATA